MKMMMIWMKMEDGFYKNWLLQEWLRAAFQTDLKTPELAPNYGNRLY